MRHTHRRILMEACATNVASTDPCHIPLSPVVQSSRAMKHVSHHPAGFILAQHGSSRVQHRQKLQKLQKLC